MNPLESNPVDQANAATQPNHAVLSPPRFPFVILFLVWLLVASTATLVTFFLPESFASTARIRVERDQADNIGLTNQPADAPYDPYFIQPNFEVLHSEVILGKVVGDLQLRKGWAARYGDGGILTFSQTLMLLKAKIELRPVPYTSLIEIRVFSEDPEEAALLANAIAQTYRDYRLKKHAEIVSAGIKQLERTYQENLQRLEGIRAEIAKLSNEPGSKDSNRLNAARGRLEQLQRVGETLSAEIAIEKKYQGSSFTSPVEIVDFARPYYRAVRPNKQLNTCVGVFVGFVAGLILASLVHALQWRAFRRTSGAAQTPFLRRFRALVYLIIALVVAFLIGYGLATPFDFSVVIMVPLLLFAGGIAAAIIALANLKPDAAPCQVRTNETVLKE